MTRAGLVLNGYRSLPEVCAPLADELRWRFCVIDVQSGVLAPSWRYERLEHEELADRLSWDVPAFADTSTHGFRPGTLPRLARHFIVDEWSYYYAIDGPEPEAFHRAVGLADHIGDLSASFLGRLGDVADLLICHADGWWEFYTGRPEWHERLRSHWPTCRERPLAQAGSPP